MKILKKKVKIEIPEFLTNKFIPNLEAVDLLEYFLISGVASLLTIRTFLNITGFPQLGGEGFHIAHMLWGGLFMLIAIMLFSSFINSTNKVIAVILGGIGFGAFIDELGKFITADNDYFYQPTIAIVYLIFILIFLIIRYLSSITSYSNKTYLANSLEALKEIVISDLDINERQRALKYLENLDHKDPVVKILLKYIKEAVPKKKSFTLFDKLSGKIFDWYHLMIKKKKVSKVIVGFFIFTSLLGVFVSFSLLMSDTNYTFTEIGFVLSSLVLAILSSTGVYYYFKKKWIKSYKYLQRATLFAIFVNQFFNFLRNELSAIIWLGLYITVYLILKGVIRDHAKKV